MIKIGILGAGQLAQMLAQAGKPLGMDFKFICPDQDACAAPFGELICRHYNDHEAHRTMSQWADVITYEFENIPTETVAALEQNSPVYPSALALKTAGDRLLEKQMFNQLGIETAQFVDITSLEDLQQAVEKLGLPAILKTRSEGYDGKGQIVIKADTNLQQAWKTLKGVPCILESMVHFDRELSVIAARDIEGNIETYPLTENHHREGILRLSLCLDKEPLQQQAEELVTRITKHLDYVGVIALELFQKGDQLIANEIAPRVHNSGHWTQDGASVSQFENHLRAISGLPLIKPELVAPTAMVNLIGTIPEREQLSSFSTATPHIYGKSERPGRKVGHINLTANNTNTALFQNELKEILNLVKEPDLIDIISFKK